MTSTTATENAQSGEEQKHQSPVKETVDTTDKQQDGDEQKEPKTDEKNLDDLNKDKLDEKASSPSKFKTLLPTKGPVHKMDYEQDVVYLYQFNRCPTIPSISPYCLKVETWLRLAGIKYENVDHKMRHRSRKGQLPFVELNGKEIADSDIIIRELSKHFDKNLDDGLTDEQRNISHAFESMLNNHTSWVVRWWRYNNPGEFLDAAQLDVKRALNSKLPKGLLTVLFKIGFRSNVKQAVGHGIGHHSTEEIYDFGKSDLKALNQSLGDKEFFFGKEPHLLDCVAFAHVSQFIYVPFGGMKEWIETETPNLVQFVARMKERLWPDWDEACSTLDLNTHLPKKVVNESSEEANKEINVKEEEKKKKEEKKRLKEEQKREKEEKKRKEKEEKERKKQEEKEKAEKEKAEKEAKAKEEKEKEEKEKAEKAEKEKAESENKKEEDKSKDDAQKTEEPKKTEETAPVDASASNETAEKKD